MRPTVRRLLATGTLLLTAGVFSTGCSAWFSSHDYNSPAPAHIINGNWVRIEDPGNFPSIVRECIAGEGIYIAQDGANGPEVVPTDPACQPGASQIATWGPPPQVRPSR